MKRRYPDRNRSMRHSAKLIYLYIPHGKSLFRETRRSTFKVHVPVKNVRIAQNCFSMTVMKRHTRSVRALLHITALVFLWTSMPMHAPFAANRPPDKSAQSDTASNSSSDCSHHDAAPEKDVNDDEDCNDASSVSCVTCKCTGPAAFALAGELSQGAFLLIQSIGATRPIKQVGS